MTKKNLGVVEVKDFPRFKLGEQARVTTFSSEGLRKNLKKDRQDALRFAATKRVTGKKVTVRKMSGDLGYVVAVEL